MSIVRLSRNGKMFAGLAAVVITSSLSAQEVPLHDWTVPPYTASASGGIHTMTDVTPPRAFVGVQPCRVMDTRGNGAPIQGGIFANSEVRNADVTGVCGIPSGADAISVNFSVVSAPATPQGAFLLAWPTGSPPSPIVALMTYGPGVTILSNSAIVALGQGEHLSINVSHSTHVIMDVNGYFSDTIENQTNFLDLVNNAPGLPAGVFRNTATANDSSGVFGMQGPAFARPGNYLAAGMRGEGSVGVMGVSQGFGVFGSLVVSGEERANGSLGVFSPHPDPETVGRPFGVYGETKSGLSGTSGVFGFATYGSGATIGVRGVTGSQSSGAAGVRGQDGGGPVPLSWPGLGISAGVRGESHGNYGVMGLTDLGRGVYGAYLGGGAGVLGCTSTTGICSYGNLSATGSKSFVEPHPTDASKMLRYISLEGNESGTYFRGRGKFQNGIAVIEVPEDFRIVTDPEGLSIQVTPIGQMATVAVESIGLDRIVVRGSRNAEFFYLVNGIRHAYKDSGPIAENDRMFVPETPDDPMPSYLPAALQQRLISNGTYTADGKVNLETARRLGWDKVWAERTRPVPQPTEP